MKDEYNDVMSVLALFDVNDIPYIKSPICLKYKSDFEKIEDDKIKVKEKKKGDNNE